MTLRPDQGAGVPAWVVDESGAFYGRSEAGSLTFTDGSNDAVLEVRGDWADELAESCRRGEAPSPASASRLVAAAAPLGDRATKLVDALLAGSFRSATASNMVRADGYDQLWIELTARCNERCVHCYADSSPERTEALDRATVLGAIADAARLGFSYIQLTGGDPLLCPFLVDAVVDARSCGLALEIFTNGLALDRKLLDAVAPHEVSFAFSLYGPDAATHDAVTRTPGSFQRTLRAIERVRSRGLELRIGVIVVSENSESANAALRLARSLAGAGSAAQLVVAREVGRGRLVRDNLQMERDAWEHAPRRTGRESHRSGRAVLCADGEVRPCIFTRWMSLGRIGRDGSLAQILSAPTPRWTDPLPADLDRFCQDRLSCGVCQRTAISLYQLSHGTSTT